ncbi:metallophosphoesterase [Halobellus sp. GM3]|uniref:metallophosphoesterase n=1 Tax=Halobellus sp. GM3 TaxID=3458410 RepID=UPI00403DA044
MDVIPLRVREDVPLPAPLRSRVDGVADTASTPPAVVSISDIHGYLDAARSALTTLSDHPEFDPLVVADPDGTLHWADSNYVLVFNGDLVDRGPANEEVLALVGRLIDEAPPGRVRVTLGNHEAIMLSPAVFGFERWFSGRVTTDDRRAFLDRIVDGHVVAAYRGYSVTYVHAGAADPYDVDEVNASLVAAAERLRGACGTLEDADAQRAVIERYDRVLGTGDGHPKGPEAGLVWLDFSHLPPDAPPQVVGHTRHDTPRRNGAVYCQNVLRNNLDRAGGEAVFVETPHRLSALVRESSGGVSRIDSEQFDSAPRPRRR